jgi:hypothetical protein
MSRRWEHELLARLKSAGHAVSVRHAVGTRATANMLDSVLAVEALRFRSSLATRSVPLPQNFAGAPDLVIDLAEQPGDRGTAAGQGAPVLTLDFAGRRKFIEGVAGMFSTKCPPELVARLDGVAVARARPMLTDRLWMSRAADDLLAGAISLIEQSVKRFKAGQLQPLAETPSNQKTNAFARGYIPFLAGGLTRRVGQKIKLGSRPPHWQVAYREVAGTGVAESLQLNGPAFAVLEDDGRRFYADPFVFEHDGHRFLFVEEYPYATGRGVISVSELDADGRFGVPRQVLAEPHHLSYPQVLAHDGEIYMIPESSSAREVVLYRAEAFPDRWVRDSVLLADKDFNDATLLESDGTFWLFGTERFGRGSPSDTMSVYFSPTLRGPWVPHPLNPIVIDHSAARPGGAFVKRDGRLFLPVQDGSQMYGGGLGLVELLKLDADGVAFGAPQAVVGGPAWQREGIHTLNRAGRLEVVDSFR